MFHFDFVFVFFVDGFCWFFWLHLQCASLESLDSNTSINDQNVSIGNKKELNWAIGSGVGWGIFFFDAIGATFRFVCLLLLLKWLQW